MKRYILYPVICLFLLLAAMTASAQTITELVDFGQDANSKGNPAFAIHGNYVYILYTDDDTNKGRICRYNLNTGEADWSGQLFDTIAADDAGHNGAAIAVDGDGYIHAWIGMHNHKMKYYRSNSPGSYNSFSNRSSEMPGYYDTGVDEKRYTYPWATTSSNGDVFVVLRRTALFLDGSQVRERQYNEKQDLYHWHNNTNTWTVDLIKKQDGRNAYMSYLFADNNNNVHIVTAWSKLHSGDNTFQRGTYLRYDVSNDKYYKADGTEVSIPIGVDTPDADLFYPGEMPWDDTTCEIQTPRVTINSQGYPVVTFPYNTNNYSQNNPDYRLDVARWTGSQWTRLENVMSGIRNHERPPITYTGDWVNIYARNSSSAYIKSSTDDGVTFTKSKELLSGGEPADAQNYDGKTDFYITYRALYKIVYPGENNLPPAAPSNLTATAVSSSQIDLSWDDNSDNEANFQIERSTDGGSSWSSIATVAANTTSYSNTGLTALTTYYYRVWAENSGGNSDYSNTASATTLKEQVIDIAAGTDMISQALVNASDGDTLLLITSGGAYQESNTLIVEKDIAIKAAAGLDEKPVWTTDATAHISLYADLVLEGIFFEGNSITESAIVNRSLSMNSLSVNNCKFENFTGRCITKEEEKIGAFNEITVTNCFLQNNGEGIVLEGYHAAGGDELLPENVPGAFILTVENTTIAHVNGSGIKNEAYSNTSDTSEVYITHVTIDDCSKEGMYLKAFTSTSVIKDCIVTNCNKGIKLKYWPPSFPIEYSCFFANGENFVSSHGASPIPGEGTIEDDPLFQPESYALQPNSPCKGTASDGKDMGDLNWSIKTGVQTSNFLPLPKKFKIFPNYPNPFNPTTILSFYLPKTLYVTIAIYNLSGQLVDTFVNAPLHEGYHAIPWDASQLGSGIYIYKIKAGSFVGTGKSILVK